MIDDKKTRKTENIESILFSVQLICVILNVYSVIWQMNEFTSLIIALNFMITAALAFITISNKNDKNTVILWIFIALLSYMAATSGKPDISFDYLKSWIMFMTTISLYFWVYAANINEKMINRIFICGIIIAILFIVGFFSDKVYANSAMPDFATFGLSNPNLAGIYLLNVFLCIFILTKFSQHRFLRFVCYAMCAVLFYFIWLTEARSCVVAALVFILLSFSNIKKYSKFINFMILIFPLIFSIIYLELVDTSFMDIFDFMEGEGKSLTSRVYIWEEAFYIIESNPIFGNYFYGSGNRHNTHLMIVAAFGVIVFGVVMVYLNRIVNYIGSHIREKYQTIALYAFYSVILMGTFESALFSGSQGMYVFSGAFLMIAKYERENSREMVKIEDD